MKYVKVSTCIMMCIESCDISNSQSLELVIKGWAFSRASKSPLTIEVLDLNRNDIKIKRVARHDVSRRYKSYEGALNSGFVITIHNPGRIKILKIKFKDEVKGSSKIHNVNLGGLAIPKRVSANNKVSLNRKNIFKKPVKNLKTESKIENEKICFITCVNDTRKYETSLKYISALNIPQGYKVENIRIDDAKYLTEAYNRAMKKTDAKYKIYLHQDVYITNKNFIRDITNIFKKNRRIGMLGVAGSKEIPRSGAWHQTNLKYGNLIHIPHPDGKQIPWKFGHFKNEYETVKAIDGLMMITQYDVPWMEDIFTGWHFYDVSQSIEFIKAGYEVAVPKMDEIWCIHDCPKSESERKKNYEQYRKVFVEEYKKYLS